MLKSIAIGLAFCSLVSITSPTDASNPKEKKTLVSRFFGSKVVSGALDAAGMAAIKKAGLLHCPKGEKCYCAKPTLKSGCKVKCKYVDKDQAYHVLDNDYTDLKSCSIACLGKALEANENDLGECATGANPSARAVQPEPLSAEACVRRGNKVLPHPNGQVVCCTGTVGKMDGKDYCLGKGDPVSGQ